MKVKTPEYNQRQRDYLEKKLIDTYGYENLIQCQICKKWFRQVGSHIWQVHRYTAREYREEFGFDRKRGQLPADLRQLKANQCKENGTIKNLESGAKFRFTKGQDTNYKRSAETMARLKKQRFSV